MASLIDTISWGFPHKVPSKRIDNATGKPVLLDKKKTQACYELSRGFIARSDRVAHSTSMIKPAMMIALVSAVAIVPVEIAAAQQSSASRLGPWEIGPWVKGRNSSIGMPERPRPGPGGSVSFDFPAPGSGEVHAMTTKVRSLAGARRITMRYRVNAAQGTRFVPAEQPAEQGTVSLYFQRAGDSWRGRGYFANYRWYVPARAVMPLTPGDHSVTIRFDEVWTNVQGQPNTGLRREYMAALAETDNVGIAFGSSSRRAHGVFATGPARFTLLGVTIE